VSSYLVVLVRLRAATLQGAKGAGGGPAPSLAVRPVRCLKVYNIRESCKIMDLVGFKDIFKILGISSP